MSEIKQYEKYNDIPKKYRWDLEDILKGDTYENWINKAINLFEIRIQNKDSKYESIESYLDDIKVDEELTLIIFKLSNYLSNNLNTNVVDAKWKKLNSDFENLFTRLNSQLGSETNRIYKNRDKLKIWKEDERLKSYKLSIEDVLDSFNHKLSDEIEDFIIKDSEGTPKPEEVFGVITNSELEYKDIVTSNNKKIKLTPVNRSKLLKNDDEKVRKQAYFNYIEAYLKHKESLSLILYQQFKQISVEAKIRKYLSSVDMLTHPDYVPETVLLKLYEKVSQSKDIFKKYRKYHKMFYQAKFKSKMQKWDVARDLVKVKSSYSVEEAKEIVRQALKPFGEEYMSQINKALDENWVDFMSAKAKRSGAYSIGQSYGLDKKYILMNFNGQLRSVETLAHELGHSMHSYYSDTRQDLQNSQYPIFLAEIASIYNELMLYDYLLSTSDNDKLKFSILEQMISGFLGTVNRQVEWSNYEYDLYKAIDNNAVSSSWEGISDIYYNNMKKYQLSYSKTKKDTEVFGAIYVPHFYYHFYVYKYAIGQLSANYFFSQYKQFGKEALDNYINNFLSAGNSKHPLDILKNVGIDLESDEFYTEGYKYVINLIEQYIQLGKKIFKLK
ncbi:oligoendopeptidase F [Mycoplasmopsis ciconiae]|uniref:Oligopeptidase F n=1 Tax=Mycoplasmopsis ciconiae TaxID=561067 RepID=A0ABU7MM42_9BACT|nr:oligoendopeptidase F [Mycoplasmopsis ciconiae]